MYLTELYNFYQRMSTDENSGMPPLGMSEEKISFKLVLSRNGILKEVISTCDTKGKPIPHMVPAAVKRASNIASNFLWDNTSYVLGVDSKGKPERTVKAFNSFKERIFQAEEEFKNERLQTLVTFLKAWNPEDFETHEALKHNHQALLDQQVIFQIEGDNMPLHLQPDVLNIWGKMLIQSDGPQGQCLITGEIDTIAKIHPAVKGIPGAQSAGAALISFNCNAFESYKKEQSFNAPVGEVAARAYVAAINYLVQRKNKQCIQLGDTRVIFWTERSSAADDIIALLMGVNPMETQTETQDTKLIEKVESFLRELRRGKSINDKLNELDSDVRFFILGLTPNAARISVRFWYTTTFGDMAKRVGQHYVDCEIEQRYPDDAEFPSIQQYLKALAPLGKTENISPVLGGQLARSVFSGSPYPESLYSVLLQRIHADKQVSYLRASLLAGYLRRNHKKGNINMSLDSERVDTSYVLGRLFALLEKAQRDALGKVNSSIKDRYIGAASATPAHVFPLLLRLAQHHLKKSSYATKKIEEVMQHIDTFPTRLSLVEQGEFFIGYYHQVNANWNKKTETEETINEDTIFENMEQ